MPQTLKRRAASPTYLFELDSEMWRINHERCGLIFGPAAAVLQIAHPRIAQGVAEHSDFRGDALGRLRRTLQATNGIAFGTVAEAEAIADHVRHIHGSVRGAAGSNIAGPPRYSAFEPDLLLWVLATLVMAAIQGWELVYGRLPEQRRETFYHDMLRFGSYFGVRSQDAPADWPEFDAYYRSMIDGDLLGSHPLCAELCHHIVRPIGHVGVRLLGQQTRFLLIETFPPTLRERVGLCSTPASRTRMRLLRATAPHWFPRLPRHLRIYPEAIERLRQIESRSSMAP